MSWKEEWEDMNNLFDYGRDLAEVFSRSISEHNVQRTSGRKGGTDCLQHSLDLCDIQ